MRLKRNYSDFYSLVDSKGLDVFIGEIRPDYYHLVAIDGDVTFECIIVKDDNADKISFEATRLPALTNNKNDNPYWDSMLTTYPSNTSDLFTYKRNNVTVMTVLVTYSNQTKKDIVSISKTRF